MDKWGSIPIDIKFLIDISSEIMDISLACFDTDLENRLDAISDKITIEIASYFK